MEAGDPSSGRRRFAEDDGGGADRISELPDAVLGDIVSLLPTKDGARTQILASRWRHIWRYAPLNLDCNVLRRGELSVVVSRILASHQGPGRRLCIPFGLMRDGGAAKLDAWLQSPAVGNLQELYLWYPRYSQLPLPLLPESVFRLSTTLCVATMEGCHIPDAAQGLQFPQLKQLTLGHVSVSECSLNGMIAGCPALECLLIEKSSGFRCVRINSGSLRSIGVRADYYHYVEVKFGELIIENAPCLEKLLHLDRNIDLHVSVISAPKLDTLRLQSPSTKMSFGSTVIQGLHIDSITTVVRSIKILAVDMAILSLNIMIDLMKCFPCLEKLYIQSFKSGPNNLWLRKHQNLIKCHDIRLKKIAFETYRGIKSQVSFLTFFVLNATVLELMTLCIEAKKNNVEFLAEHRRKLQLENRASRGARFQFSTDICVRNSWDIKGAHDLDVADPFAC